MKNFLFLAALASLAACSDEKTDPDAPVAAKEVDAPAVMPIAADGNPSVGFYRAVDQEDVVLMEELRADGTYVFADEAGKVLEEGRWIQKSPAHLCFTASSERAAEICYNEEVNEDGTWVSTNAQTGEIATIERLEK